MSRADTMRDGYAAYNRRDFSFVDDIFAPDVDWSTPGPDGPLQGRAAVRGFFEGLATQFAAHEIAVDSQLEQGDRLVCFVTHRFTTHDGAVHEVAGVHDWRFRGEQVASMREVADTMAFAIAAGMIPQPA